MRDGRVKDALVLAADALVLAADALVLAADVLDTAAGTNGSLSPDSLLNP